MSRRRLRRTKSLRREIPVSRASASNLAIRRRPPLERRLRKEPRLPLDGAGQTNIRTFQRLPPGTGGKTGFAAPPWGCSPGWGGSGDPPGQRDHCFKGPRTPQAPPRGSGETQKRLAPAKLPKELRRPGLERHSRAGRERRSSPKGTEARRPAEPFEPATGAPKDRNPPPPPDRDPRKGIAVLRGAAPRKRSAWAEARPTDHDRRQPGAFAWQISVARILENEQVEN
jgi:hypothetical protein